MNDKNEQISFKQSQMKIVDIYSWLQGKVLQYRIKIQRNSAWRTEDRVELIDTIINGFPIPPIFISSGILDEDQMKNIYHVLDGRQRLETIELFINGNFSYKGKHYKDLDKDTRIKILNYFIPLITIDDSDISQLKEIFRRLNKTAIRLNRVEITSSQYFEYSFMIFSKLAVSTKEYEREIEDYIKETKFLYQNGENPDSDEDLAVESLDENDEEIDEISEGDFSIANLQKGLSGYETILKNNVAVYSLFTDSNLFSEYEINRQVNLQHFLNIFVTIIENEIAISRSVVATQKKLQKKIEEYSSGGKKEEIIEKYMKFKVVCNKVQDIFNMLDNSSIFKNKSSLYSFLTFFYYNDKLINENTEYLVNSLNNLSHTSTNYLAYERAIQERVNDKSFREKRYEILCEIFSPGQNN